MPWQARWHAAAEGRARPSVRATLRQRGLLQVRHGLGMLSQDAIHHIERRRAVELLMTDRQQGVRDATREPGALHRNVAVRGSAMSVVPGGAHDGIERD